MAIFYLSLLGSNTSPYDTWAKAATNIPQILALPYTGSNVILCDEGTYFGPGGTYYIFLANVRDHNMSILGSRYGETETFESSRDTVIFEAGASEHCLYANRNNILIENLTLNIIDKTFRSVYLHTPSVDFVARNIRANGTIYADAATDWTFYRPIVDGAGVNGFYFKTTASGKLYYPLVTGGEGICGYGIWHQSSGTIDIINPTIANASQSGILFNGLGVCNIFNPITIGTGVEYDNFAIRQLGSGTLNVYNGGVLNSDFLPLHTIDGATIEDDIIELPDVEFNIYGREGYVVPCVDDAGRFGYAEELADKLAEYGYTGTFYPHGSAWEAAHTSLNADLRAMVAAGVMEVGNHSWSHSSAQATTGMTISYIGGDSNPTIALVAGTPRNIELRTTEGNDDADISLTTNPTFEDIKTAIDALNWSCTLLIGTLAKESSLDVISAQAAPYTLLLLRTDETEGYFQDECSDSKDYMESVVNGAGDVTDGQTGETYECSSFSNPFTYPDPDYRSAVKAVGHTSERVASFRSGLSSLDHFSVVTIAIQQVSVSGDKETTQTAIRALAQNAVMSGKLLYIYSHSTAEATMEDWGWILDVLAEYSNINVMSSQLAIADILDKADSYDSGTGVSVRTFTPQTDFSFKKGSVCIDAGLNTPLSGVVDVKDQAGNIITDGSGVVTVPGGTVDMGAFEFQPAVISNDVDLVAVELEAVELAAVELVPVLDF